jgi:Holliday junction resolvase-like predicted endonuclease
LDRNWRPHDSEVVGEVDLIARDGDALVIVEVTTPRWSAEGMSLDDIAVRSGVSRAQSRTRLAQAEEMGLVQRRGQDRWVYVPADGAHGRA